MTLKTYMTQNGLQVLYKNIEARLDEREVVLKERILQEVPSGSTIVEVKQEIKQEVKGEVKDELKDELKDQIKQEVLEELTPGSGGSDDIEKVSDDDIDSLFG